MFTLHIGLHREQDSRFLGFLKNTQYFKRPVDLIITWVYEISRDLLSGLFSLRLV